MSETTISPRSNFSFNINANGSISTTSPTATIVSNSNSNNPPQKRIRATGEVLNFLILEFEKIQAQVLIVGGILVRKLK